MQDSMICRCIQYQSVTILLCDGDNDNDNSDNDDDKDDDDDDDAKHVLTQHSTRLRHNSIFHSIIIKV